MKPFLALSIIFIMIFCPSGICSDFQSDSDEKEIIDALDNLHKDNFQKYNSIMILHSKQKKSIPYLINDIDNTQIIAFPIGNPRNSNRTLDYFCNYGGVWNAFIIDLILAKEQLLKSSGKVTWAHGNHEDNYLYWDGRIVRNDSLPLKADDLYRIKRHYEEWWKNNQDKSIEELRIDWKNGKRPLEGTTYFWE